MTEVEKHLVKYQAEFAATKAAVPVMRTGDVYQTGQGIALIVNHVVYGQVPVEDVLNGIALAEEVTLTADGQTANNRVWHEGEPADGNWIYYERWTTEGRIGHGYVDRITRKLVQAG